MKFPGEDNATSKYHGCFRIPTTVNFPCWILSASRISSSHSSKQVVYNLRPLQCRIVDLLDLAIGICFSWKKSSTCVARVVGLAAGISVINVLLLIERRHSQHDVHLWHASSRAKDSQLDLRHSRLAKLCEKWEMNQSIFSFQP